MASNTSDYLDFNGTHLKIPDQTQSLAELRQIADAASERAEIARQQAVSAQEQARKTEKDALFSKIVAIVSLAASIIIPLIV